jgi:polyphosphate glucokinase
MGNHESDMTLDVAVSSDENPCHSDTPATPHNSPETDRYLSEPHPAEPVGVMTLSVDIGGSGIKAIALDSQGHPLGERLRQDTPTPATPDALIPIIHSLADQQGTCDRVSVGFPGVVQHGIIYSAANLDPQWIGYPLETVLRERLGKPVRIANDADVQGLGAIAGQGVELVITLGTGLGSALFVNGHLVPNLEMGHHPFRKGDTYEQQLGRAALEAVGKKRWNRRLEKAIANWQALFNCDRLYLGGGEAKQITLELAENVTVIPNILGLLGGIALWRD